LYCYYFRDGFLMKWLSIVGIGEDGLSGISDLAVSLIHQGEIVIGGSRHLAMIPVITTQQRLTWSRPINDSVQEILTYRGRRVCVLASGDPLFYGIGTTLLREVPIEEMTIIPSPSALSLGCAKLGWSIPEVDIVSLCGRPICLLNSYLYDQARLIVLSGDRSTPEKVAENLVSNGFGQSPMTILEHLGGVKEKVMTTIASSFNIQSIADLNLIAIQVVGDTPNRGLSRLSGLPDEVFHHDGQITKREVRSITLSNLAPLPGQLLWDVGAGCGSISIEWLRSHPRCVAYAIEHHPQRLQYIADNAQALGVPNLQIIAGLAPDRLMDLPTPDAIFIGGGVTQERVLEVCWRSLKMGGRLVVNAVTLESEQKVIKSYQELGGELIKINIQRTTAIGNFTGWKNLSSITQWTIIKN
jgi:precorrin-6Y C5,15-methyltransferase (decarboxylating)